MSTLQVANIWFESTGNNRLQYNGSNNFSLIGGGSTVLTINTTAASFPGTIQATGTVNFATANVQNQTLADGSSINWNVSQGTIATVTLAGNRVINNPTNMKVGTMMLIIVQDATGSRTLSFGSAYKWPSGVAPVLTTTPNAVDIISFYCNGTNVFGSILPDLR